MTNDRLDRTRTTRCRVVGDAQWVGVFRVVVEDAGWPMIPAIIPVDYGESFDLEAYRRWARIETFRQGQQWGQAALDAELRANAGEGFVPAGMAVATYREAAREPLFTRLGLRLKHPRAYVTIPVLP